MEFYLVLTVEPVLGREEVMGPRVRIIHNNWYLGFRSKLQKRDSFYERGPIVATEEVLEQRFRAACERLDINSGEVHRMTDLRFSGRQHMFSDTQDVDLVRRAVDVVPLEIR